MELEEMNIQGGMKQEEITGSMKNAGLFFFLLMVFEIPASLLIGFVQRLMPAQYNTLISILITQGYLLIGAILYIRITKKHLGTDLQMRKYRISTFFLSLLVLITASPMASWLNIFSQLFVTNETSGAIYSVTQNVPMWMGILIIGCLPGFIEETLYRGIIYTAFRKRSVLTGIVVSALSFGLMHMNFNQILYAIYLGVVFALLVEATGSLVSTMLLHMLFNAINTSYVYILPKLYEWLGTYSEEYASINIEEVFSQTPDKAQLLPMLGLLTPLAIGGIVLTILLIKAIAIINNRPFSWSYFCGGKEETAKTKPVNVCLILGWIFCLVFAILNMLAA
ncbi:MAG: lysostaphin resistance A-like protein [Lachnospiraceae bacterium]